jgi:hypothetical protein
MRANINIILKCTLEIYAVKVWTSLNSLSIRLKNGQFLKV